MAFPMTFSYSMVDQYEVIISQGMPSNVQTCETYSGRFMTS